MIVHLDVGGTYQWCLSDIMFTQPIARHKIVPSKSRTWENNKVRSTLVSFHNSIIFIDISQLSLITGHRDHFSC